MMKKGKLIALEAKDKLLAHSTSREIALKLSAPLPATLAAAFQAREIDGRHILTLPDIAHLEDVLRELRQGAVEVRELSVHETDLEQVFVELMNGGKQ